MVAPIRPADGLLDQIAEHALDDDYYVVRSGEPFAERSHGTVLVGAVIAVFAALVTVAAVQTQAFRPSNELERRTLAADVADRREVLAAREATVASLRDQVAGLRAGDAPQTSLEGVEVLSGAQPVTGEALVVTLAAGAGPRPASRVSLDDVLVVVNGLWYAGAEAVAIGDQRVGATSSIGSVDGALTVNYRKVAAPVRIVAIGDSQAMRTRLESGPTDSYLQRRAERAGLSVGLSRSDEETLPAVPEQRVQPQYAAPVPTEETRPAEEQEGQG